MNIVNRVSCNICGSSRFEAYKGRAGERCCNCSSKARHRVGLDVYQRMLFPLAHKGARLLHFAPEEFLHPLLLEKFGTGYFTADMAPERYRHAQALKIALPNGLEVFPDKYFDAVIHNHVLEHVPGHYGDHLTALLRVIKPGGLMIFSIPGPYQSQPTLEGGEHLGSDSERLAQFLQEDHFKRFGNDFVAHLRALSDAVLIPDGMTDARRLQLSVRPGKAPFFVLRKKP